MGSSITLSPMRREQWYRGWFSPFVLPAIIVALSGMWSCAKPMKPGTPHRTTDGVRFTLLAPGSKNVCVVGSFNGWVKGVTPMKMVEGALWSVIVPLQEGEYAFMYVIDGTQWVTPPHADDFVTDGFGQTNGVVVVR
jgi:1,4-alpha-glucan branching enzyme